MPKVHVQLIRDCVPTLPQKGKQGGCMVWVCTIQKGDHDMQSDHQPYHAIIVTQIGVKVNEIVCQLCRVRWAWPSTRPEVDLPRPTSLIIT